MEVLTVWVRIVVEYACSLSEEKSQGNSLDLGGRGRTRLSPRDVLLVSRGLSYLLRQFKHLQFGPCG